MKNVYHILNGDALKAHFPNKLKGELIIFRECLVDGEVGGETDKAFYQTRARFISEEYEGCTASSYFEKTVPELEKIKGIHREAEVNLWFEDDLFCQVNCWYVLDCLHSQNHLGEVYLVRPSTDLMFGFSALDQEGLKKVFQKRQKVTKEELKRFSGLWKNYLFKNDSELYEIVNELKEKYSFLYEVVEAEVARKAPEGEYNRPEKSLLTIMSDLGTKEFGPVFREFCKRESIYGFGDLQVKRILKKLH